MVKLEIQKQLINQSAVKRPMIPLNPKWLTIHSTGNPKSTAQNEHDFLASSENTRQASFHVVVDAKQAILCVPLNEVAYHAGDGQGDGNRASIGLEICESGNRKTTLANGAAVAAELLVQFGLDISRMVQHNHWSGKNCPRILRDEANIKGGMDWAYFVKLVKKEMAVMLMKKLAVIMPNGKELKLAAVEVQDANYVGIRELLEALGYKVGYGDGKVSISK